MTNLAVMIMCLAAASSRTCSAAGAPSLGATANDIIITTSATSTAANKYFHPTDIAVYTAKGKLRGKIRFGFPEGAGTLALEPGFTVGISGNADFAILGGPGTNKNNSIFQVVRIARNRLPKKGQTQTIGDIGFFEVPGNFNFGSTTKFGGNNLLAAGSVDTASGDGFVIASERITCSGKPGEGAAIRFVELRYVDGRVAKPTMKRGRSFVAYRSATCNDEMYPRVLGMRTLGDKLYAVVCESPAKCTMRSFDAFAKKPTMSAPIANYNGAVLYEATIDSPTSFVAITRKTNGIQELIRSEKGKNAEKRPLISKTGKYLPTKGRFLPGFTSLTNGKGLLLSQSIQSLRSLATGQKYPGIDIILYKTTSLKEVGPLLTLQDNTDETILRNMTKTDKTILRGMTIMPAPRQA